MRLISRVFIVFGILAMVASWRLDQAVGTAYRTDWVAPQFVARQQSSLFGCANCWRLPSESWLWTYALTGSAALLALLVATLLFHVRHYAPDEAEEGVRQGRQTTPRGVRHVAVGGGIAVFLIAIAETIVRQLAARGHGRSLIIVDTALDATALVILGIIVIAAAAGSPTTTGGAYTLLGRIVRFLYRQRVNVLGLLLLTTALMFVAQTSGQAIDSIRTWGFDSAHSIARFGFGIGGALLLSLVIYESAVQLTQVTTRSRKDLPVPGWLWLALGGALVALGIVLVTAGPFGYGPIVIGVIALLLGVLEIPNFEREEEEEIEKHHDERVAEILAVVPLLVFAATGVAAAIDAALSGGKWNALGPLLPTAILAGAAILMTAEYTPRRFDVPGWRAIVVAVLVVGVASLLLAVFESDVGAAMLALVGCAAALLYTWWLFHVLPPKKRDPKLCCSALSLAIAIAVGTGTLIAVHVDTFGSTNTLGTLTLISFGAAFWLAVLNFFVYSSFHLRPPSALRYIGLKQLPVVILVVIAWIGAGAIRTPPTLHEARLTTRHPLATAEGPEVIPNAPTLSDAFAGWVRAQPELNRETAGRSRAPIPMFLVAAHGGGIRAAYWTGIALDCLVGVSAAGLDPAMLQAGDDPTREVTCESRRRTRVEQEAAARRIFLVSGVSGGAMGLYAYARQLISEGYLEDGAWVDERLGGDFASATIGWGLFHDVPNHWFGLNSHRGGDCGWHIGSTCMTADRAAIHEEAFDRVWPEGQFAPLLRLTWDMRSSTDVASQRIARTIPLVITNTTVTGGKARGVVSAANLGTWPNLEAYDPGRGNFDKFPLAGTVEVVEAACATKDLRLSTAALLGSRFPYVSPSGHLSGQCRRSKGGTLEADKSSACASVTASICEMRLVDGGYADNSGLFSIDVLWSSIRQLVMKFNETSDRKIAPVIVELDNHYRARLDAELSAAGIKAESVVPLLTAFGARTSIETFARLLAYRLRPPGCTVTISPGLHPGLTAPLGWELSEGARDDLRDGLVRPHPTAVGESRYRAVFDIRRLQQWLGTGNEPSPGLTPNLKDCIPTGTSPQIR
jgi:hypothetical protein